VISYPCSGLFMGDAPSSLQIEQPMIWVIWSLKATFAGSSVMDSQRRVLGTPGHLAIGLLTTFDLQRLWVHSGHCYLWALRLL
jgi:hypothetical protein